VTEPTFTRQEFDELMRWRLARMRESGETMPTMKELIAAMKQAIKEAQREKR
jgi:hypothetical protein